MMLEVYLDKRIGMYYICKGAVRVCRAIRLYHLSEECVNCCAKFRQAIYRKITHASFFVVDSSTYK